MNATINDPDREFLRVYAACLKEASRGRRNFVLHNRKLGEVEKLSDDGLILDKLSQRGISMAFRPPTVEESTVTHSYDGYTWYKEEAGAVGWYRMCNGDCDSQWYPEHKFVGRTILWW